jgi:hypothetical protein
MENESPRAPRKENFNYRLADRFGSLLWARGITSDDESLRGRGRGIPFAVFRAYRVAEFTVHRKTGTRKREISPRFRFTTSGISAPATRNNKYFCSRRRQDRNWQIILV